MFLCGTIVPQLITTDVYTLVDEVRLICVISPKPMFCLPPYHRFQICHLMSLQNLEIHIDWTGSRSYYAKRGAWAFRSNLGGDLHLGVHREHEYIGSGNSMIISEPDAFVRECRAINGLLTRLTVMRLTMPRPGPAAYP